MKSGWFFAARRVSLRLALFFLAFPMQGSAQTHDNRILSYSDKLSELLDSDAAVELVAEGFEWAEGPLWVNRAGGYLLFSDVPQNRIYRWSQLDGVSVFLEQSGFEGEDSSSFREPGSNGLIQFDERRILAANHGQRELTLITLANGAKNTYISRFLGKPFNSPNDLVMTRLGAVYFTDPPFGLKGINDSPDKQQPVNGVYVRFVDGGLQLVTGELSYPNGIGLLPDGRTLIVSNADPANPVWMRYALGPNGLPTSSSVFHDATAQVLEGQAGLPDGMAIDALGNVFASGPGGIYIFSPQGELLGKIQLDRAAANCTFGGANGSTLYITADDRIYRVQTRTRGL